MPTCVSEPRPVCATCDKPVAAIKHYYDENGVRTATNWRAYCASCHTARGKNYNDQMAAFDTANLPCCGVNQCDDHVTIMGTDIEGNLQFSKYCSYHSKYLGSMPIHLRWRKTFCENIDGRLGFKCTTTVPFDPPLPPNSEWMFDYGFPQPMLTVDHIDGDPYNEPEDGSNFQTLCACCHAYKSWKNGDALTPGRKSKKILLAVPV